MRWSNGEAAVDRLLAAGHRRTGPLGLTGPGAGSRRHELSRRRLPTAALSWPTTRRGRPASPSWPSRVCARPPLAAIALSKKSSGPSSARH